MRGSVARALVPALVVLGLVAVVAIAATGSTPSGSEAGRRAPGVLGGTILGLALVAAIASAAFVVYALAHKGPPEYPRTWGGLTQLVALATFLITVVVLNLRDWSLPGLDKLQVAPPQRAFTSNSQDSSTSASDARETWLAVVVVLALAAIGAAAFYLSARSRRRLPTRALELVDTLDEVLSETLDDLRREADPRRTVIAVYARLERAFAAYGLPRRRAETQEEHVSRILGELAIDRAAVRRLVELYTWAKFSHHDVNAGMKDEAIETLERLRGELSAARARSEDRRPEDLDVHHEPA